jgi:hypothetical protein
MEEVVALLVRAMEYAQEMIESHLSRLDALTSEGQDLTPVHFWLPLPQLQGILTLTRSVSIRLGSIFTLR